MELKPVTPSVRVEELSLPRLSIDGSDAFELTGYADTSLTDEVRWAVGRSLIPSSNYYTNDISALVFFTFLKGHVWIWLSKQEAQLLAVGKRAARYASSCDARAGRLRGRVRPS
jgi:hypothetical protein